MRLVKVLIKDSFINYGNKSFQMIRRRIDLKDKFPFLHIGLLVCIFFSLIDAAT